MASTAKLPKCSFCGKPQDDVKKLIAAPGVYICDECVSLCNEILQEESEWWGWVNPEHPKPEPKRFPEPNARYVSLKFDWQGVSHAENL